LLQPKWRLRDFLKDRIGDVNALLPQHNQNNAPHEQVWNLVASPDSLLEV
jgi:hypothetical protein